VRPGRPSLTARWVAAQRLRLLDERPVFDPAGAAAERRLYEGFGTLLRTAVLHPTGMVERTRFFDDESVAALDRGISQAVVVGAGYDGRALRFARDGVVWFEIDHPSTHADKRRRLQRIDAPLNNIRFAAVDLMTDDLAAALDATGQDATRATLFICEGLFPYLDPSTGASLCSTLRTRAAPGSVLAANFLVRPEPMPVQRVAQQTVDAVLAVIGERRLNEFRPGDAERLIESAGWAVVRRRDPPQSRQRNDDPRGHLLCLAAEPRP
jgi:methyltransferase (TIGR00027 family)